MISQAAQKEREAAELLEPSEDVEPVRSILYYNAAALALKSQDYELTQQLVEQAMVGIPPRYIIEDLRQIKTASVQPSSTTKDKTEIREPRKPFKASTGFLITNLPRRSRFLNQLVALLPQAEAVDIFASDFEIASFILLTGQWQFADQVRIVVGRSSLPSTETVAGNPVFDHQSLAIEREKAKTDDLSGLLAVNAALSDNRFAHLGINSIRGHLILKERAIEAMI